MKKLTLALLTLTSISIMNPTSTLAADAPATPAKAVMPNPDSTLIDTATDPCQNYFQYACGTWLKTAEIPGDRPSWGRGFAEVEEKNQLLLKDVLEKYSNGKFEPENPYAQKLGNLYASCMDESKLEGGAVKTLNAKLKELDAVTKQTLVSWIAKERMEGIRLFFSLSDTQDAKHPEDVIAGINQAGMGLPTKEYYVSKEPRMVELREKYKKYIAKILQVSGEDEKQSQTDAASVLALETHLAEGALTPVEMRDPLKTYHPLAPKAVEELAPNFAWNEFYQDIGIKDFKVIDVAWPDYLKTVNEVLTSTPLAEIKAYLKFSLLSGSARGLPDRFYKENFDFYAKTLSGYKEVPARWKRCVQATNELMGFALGRSFVSLTFSGPSKDIARTMIEQIEKTEGKVIDNLPWMDAKTKKEAHAKLKNLVNHVGYPDVWRNYDSLEIDRDSYLANRYAAARFTSQYNLNKIGKPLNRSDWDMVPSAVNAYYEPQMDKMVFPAGILQPPFFNASYDAPANYGGIGMVMGHEMSHGFDDEGRHYDHTGAMQDWWSPKSATEFEKRASCLAKQYDTYETVGGGHVNGKLTLGEDIGDQGGIKLAYTSWRATVSKQIAKDPAKLREEEKKFFLSFAQTWCAKDTEAYEKLLVSSNPHPPARFRVNGPLSDLPAFAETYQCKAGSKMVPADRCVVW